MNNLPFAVALAAVLSACSATAMEEAPAANEQRLSERVPETADRAMSELLAHQPYVGRMAMPDGRWSIVMLTVTERTAPEHAGLSTIHVCEADLEKCASNEGAPPMPFTLDRDDDGWKLNLRTDRSSTPLRTHELVFVAELGGVRLGGMAPTVRTDLPSSLATAFVPEL